MTQQLTNLLEPSAVGEDLGCGAVPQPVSEHADQARCFSSGGDKSRDPCAVQRPLGSRNAQEHATLTRH